MHFEQIPHKMKPRDNQEVAIDAAVEGLTGVGFHGLLMEMSLGKTKVSLNVAEILDRYQALKRVLVIAPKKIQSVWTDQIPEHTYMDSVPLIWENKKTDKFKRQREALLREKFPILIVRLEMFQKNNLVLKKFLEDFFTEPTLCVLDESSKIKNVTTQRTPRLIEYTQGAAYKMILTGTPWTESPLDIFSQMEFLHTGFWYKTSGPWKVSVLKKHWFIFRNRYAIMQSITTAEGRAFKKIVGTRRQEEIARKIQPYVTQQKKDVWLDLPEKQYQTLHVQMSGKQASAYKEMKERLILEYGDTILTAANAAILTTRLRQIAGGFYPGTGEPIDTEIPGIEMLVEDVAEYPGQVIVAASYVAEIKGIQAVLEKLYGCEQVATYYGGTKDPDGELRRFKNGAKFMVLNPQSGGYGLNLQFSSLMYLYSRPYSYEQNAQLEDRIDRPPEDGEVAEMSVYKEIIHVGSIQEKVLRAIKDKKDVVDAFDKMTMKEILDE